MGIVLKSRIMKNLLILGLLSSIAVQSRAQVAEENCQTPNNRNGICVSIKSCDSLSRLLQQPVLYPEVRSFLEQSRCGNIENYVCCPGEEGTTTPTRRGSTPTTRGSTPTRRGSTPTTRGSTQTTERFTSTTQSQMFYPRTNISARKCREYADFAYNKTYTVNGPGVKLSNCALTFTGVVIGGKYAKLREFPHMALIGFTYDNDIHWDCGGTLISERFVLSAQHCNVASRPAKYVRLGEHDLNRTDDSYHSDFDIIQAFSHNDAIRRTYNDIVLFKLDRNVDFNHFIRPACLPEQFAVPDELIGSGWGRVEVLGNSSNVLQKVKLETFPKSQWSRTAIGQQFSRRAREETIIFAGHTKERKDTCQGDSGGPLQFLHETHHCTYVVVGVTSTGGICGTIGSPAVYTRVYSHLSWIEQIVWPNE